jgi:hypothetical protein
MKTSSSSNQRSCQRGRQDAYVQGVLDRQGKYREVEYLIGDRDQAEIPMEIMRKEAIKPATIDGNPCELMVQYSPLY